MKQVNTKSSQIYSNQGFSLIELMISMTLGLTLIGGLMSMYIGSRSSDKTRTELSDIETNARLALSTLRQGIEHAGYRSVNSTPLDKPFHTPDDGSIDNPSCRDTSDMVLSGLGANNDGLLNPPSELEDFTKNGEDTISGSVTTIGSDSITVIFRPDSPDKGEMFTDCAFGGYEVLNSSGVKTSSDIEDHARQIACSTDTSNTIANGMENPLDAKIYNGFFLRQDTGEPKQLVCYGSRSSNTKPQVIADNIENMQILYGVLMDGSTTYKNAAVVESNSQWESVISVQVAILVGSENTEVLINPPSTRSYKLLDKTVNKTSSDHRMYKVYSTTINLPNRTQGGFL